MTPSADVTVPVAATVLVAGGLAAVSTVPVAALPILAGLVAGAALLAGLAARPLALPVPARTLALRAAAGALVVVGGPLMAAAEWGADAVGVVAAAALATVLAWALLPAPRPVDDGCGHTPRNVRR